MAQLTLKQCREMVAKGEEYLALAKEQMRALQLHERTQELALKLKQSGLDERQASRMAQDEQRASDEQESTAAEIQAAGRGDLQQGGPGESAQHEGHGDRGGRSCPRGAC